MERSEYEKFTPSEMVEYFEKMVLWHVTQMEEALAERGAESELYNIRVWRPYNKDDAPLRVEANVQLKALKASVKSDRGFDKSIG
jgi:hypothetical protein